MVIEFPESERMKSGLYIKKDKVRVVLAGLKAIPGETVLVGIPAAETVRSGDGSSDNMTNAALGYIHETGAPEVNIPSRPFLVPGVRDQTPSITRNLKEAAKAKMDGDSEKAFRYLHAAGMAGVKGAQRRITTGPFAPLAASTLRARRRRGRTGTRPLIDTGQLRRSLTHVIRKET